MSDRASEPLVLRDVDGGICTLTLNRPDKHNAVIPAMFEQLRACVEELALAGEQIGVVVLRGAGRSFCAGHDLREAVGAMDLACLREESRTLERLSQLPQIVIAAVHGYCMTGGLELALAADIIVASESARFADTHAKFGLVPMWGGTQRLPRRVGAAKAIELMATCRRLDGREAERIGLATQCVPDAGFDAAVTGMAREILANSWHSNASIKQLVHQTDGLTLRDGLAHEQFRSPGSRRRGVFPPSPVRTGATPLMTQTPANADWPRQGGCLCGAVRYTISSAPGAAVVCHCTHCQKQGGSLFAFNLVLADTQYEQHGTTKIYTDSGDSGQPVYRHFCADCGSPITSRLAARPGMVIVKGGTLDDRSGLSPRMEVYCRSSEPWLPALPVQARFDTMPPTPQVKV